MAVTVRTLDAAKPQAAAYKLTVERGLYLRVATDGTKSWLVRYVIDGKQRQARLSKLYGQGDAFMSLADARAENARIQALARENIDFREQANAERQQREEAKARARVQDLTLTEMFNAWVKDGVARADGNAELRRAFGADILPAIGNQPVRAITEGDLLAVLRKVGRERGRGRAAEVLLANLRQLFRWAEKRQPWRGLLVEGNPAELVSLKQVVKQDYSDDPRDRVLTSDEVRELQGIFNKMEAGFESADNRRNSPRPVKKETQLALWICLSTACRIGELLKSRWEHVNLDIAEWYVPAENTKTGVAWTVRLSPFAKRQFEDLQKLTGTSAWCFPARTKNDMPVCQKSVSKQVGDRQERFKERTVKLKNRRQDNTLVLANGSRGAWTPHDLRRTAATMMQQLGVLPDVIDRCQNHVLAGSKMRRHYLHHDYASETREAWHRLGQHIEAILAGTT